MPLFEQRVRGRLRASRPSPHPTEPYWAWRTGSAPRGGGKRSPKSGGPLCVCTTYASLARRAGADLRLLQKPLGHASITVTAHIYADLDDDELDDVASALDRLDDTR
jgi:integrase